MVVLRKNLSVARGEQVLFDDIRYFFYITNLRDRPADAVVREANRRCNQENLIAQLKSCRGLHAPVNTLLANWAYMVMASLAWTIKAWMALLLPFDQAATKRQARAQQRRWLTMEFRTFLNAVVGVPAQVLRAARRTVVRFLAWRPELDGLVRLALSG